MATNLLTKVAQNFGYCLSYFVKHQFLNKTIVATFGITFWKYWATFYCNIWSHWWVESNEGVALISSYLKFGLILLPLSCKFGWTIWRVDFVPHRTTIQMVHLYKRSTREPWSCGYGRRLTNWRSWVQILAFQIHNVNIIYQEPKWSSYFT